MKSTNFQVLWFLQSVTDVSDWSDNFDTTFLLVFLVNLLLGPIGMIIPGLFNLSLDHFGFCDPRLFKSGDYLNLMTFSNLLFEEEKKDAYLSAFLLWFMLKAAKKRVFSRLFHFASVFIYRAMKCQDMKNASPPCFGNYFSIVCVCTVDCIKMRFYYIASGKKILAILLHVIPIFN